MNKLRRHAITDPEKVLEMWILREPMTCSEIAMCMGLCRQAVRTIEVRALKKIRAVLDRELDKLKESA